MSSLELRVLRVPADEKIPFLSEADIDKGFFGTGEEAGTDTDKGDKQATESQSSKK